jgi:hypothetical protein
MRQRLDTAKTRQGEDLTRRTLAHRKNTWGMKYLGHLGHENTWGMKYLGHLGHENTWGMKILGA